MKDSQTLWGLETTVSFLCEFMIQKYCIGIREPPDVTLQSAYSMFTSETEVSTTLDAKIRYLIFK